ncbi:MAG: CCA tRNA nucleotidyltransferase, partial [Deltaproteobacteria bacterium]|nr:CCA tRNA nucleotidyltransferase [Deltaproteobacteria bacterium]
MPEPRHTTVQPPWDDPAFQGARWVVEVLREAGNDAWIVGGAVRDLIMGLRPVDFDIATSARPEAVMALFRRTVPVGVQFGVVRVLWKDMEYEVATFRSDHGYSDGRRPDAVVFTDLARDVGRRDFTMNGLILDPETGDVTDLVGGLEDIEAGLIRAIGVADRRFEEDRLRPLRAIRFAAQTGFEIEKNTLEAISDSAPGTDAVSSERVRDELSKMLASNRPGKGLCLAESTGVLPIILPELAVTDCKHLAATLDRLAKSPLEVLWAALFVQNG